MKRFHISRPAQSDLAAIWDYIAMRSGAGAADRVLAEIYDAIQLLADNPLMGHARADVKNPKYRFWTVYSYVMAYRPDRKPITIARVVHGARDFARLFGS
jgi:antitoxin ParD1/3/4/toxin ParE1/3/4